MSDNHAITFAFYLVFGFFILLLLIVYFVLLPLKSRASAGAITIKIKVQGNHKDNDQLNARIDFYNGPNKAYEEPNTTFTYTNNAYAADITLPSDFNYQDRYALFIKPIKYQGRIFCTTQVTGVICTVPQFIFFANGNMVDLSPFLFYAGDVLPANGKIDALDMSLIMKDLGKTDLEAQTSDLNNDQIVDVVDYSLALYSLSHNISDDQIKLIAPPPMTSSIQPITPTDIASPSPSVTPSPIVTLTPTSSPTPIPTATPIPKLGKNCMNGTEKITQSINSDWELNVLPIPYRNTNSQYRCVPAENIVLHWSGSPSFHGNGATWGTLNTRNRMCGLAIDSKEILQMSNFYDDKITWEGSSALDNAINIEINGTQFDLWYNKTCQIVNPTSNNALSSGELENKKQETAAEYGILPNVFDWENDKYVSIMEEQEEKVLSAIEYLLIYYDIPKENVTGHFNVDSGTGKSDPGPRFLECIKKKL